MPPASSKTSDLYWLSPACLEDERCRTTNNSDKGRSFLTIDRVQFSDAGTYLCSAEKNKDCEVSFNFTGNVLTQCIQFS